jgi:cytoskeletal protein CcmA (bactofilin family)
MVGVAPVRGWTSTEKVSIMFLKQSNRPETPSTPATPSSATAAGEDKLPSAKPAWTPPVAVNPLPTGDSRSSLLDENGKRLIVGDGIKLKGEITACDRLIVEGHVEVTLNETRMLEIKPSGKFIGSCEVEEAEISGIYDGDLTVRGRLTVRSTGKATGKIHYGEIELERGGQIAGELSVRDRIASGAQKPASRTSQAA